MKLTNAQKCFIVQSLARWKTPTEVVELVAEEWPETKGKLTRMHVHSYNPDGARCEMSQKFRDLFDETRAKFQAAVGEIAIAQPAYRVRELLDMYWTAKKSKNMVLAAQLLEQAAKETGGMFTNRRIIGGVVGYRDLSKATDEQLDAILAGADPEEVLDPG